jgi:anthranilate synthase component 1
MVPDVLLIFDNLKHSITIVTTVDVDSKRKTEKLYKEAVNRIDKTLHLISEHPLNDTKISTRNFQPQFSSNTSKREFSESVEKIVEAIHEGEAIQVVYSQRIESPFSGNPFDLYRVLRQVNPSPYLFYLNMPDCVLIGASPELLVKVENGLIDLRPIAGTRPRGKDAEEEERLEADLLADEKERAEHVMLVDLGRNDLGRVSAPGTVEVTEMMTIERYSHVIHIVSHVQGKLAEGRDCFDLLSACFPAGTVSGAPKVRAMEIIEEMETQRRGTYAGAVGYFAFSGDMELCITIRSILVYGGKTFIQVGAGIVADSQPETEYEETMHKAGAMIRSIELAGKGGES